MRFYTYVSTMILAMQSAADAGIEFVVLDRPNPLGGERVEGPDSDPRDAVPESLVNTAPGPLVHGLTAGEMAQFVNASLAKPARLTVVPMKGWRRNMSWADTGRPWVPPSPNLRSPEARARSIRAPRSSKARTLRGPRHGDAVPVDRCALAQGGGASSPRCPRPASNSRRRRSRPQLRPRLRSPNTSGSPAPASRSRSRTRPR